MKILLCHNFYGSSAPSGENTVFQAEAALLRQHNHQVIEFIRSSDDIRHNGITGLVRGACATPWNPFSKARLRRVLQDEKPDVMHVHNTFPLLSPSVFYAARDQNTAVVLSLHNYRLFCAAGIPMRDDLLCTTCLDRNSVIPALQYGCYRNSRLATFPLALMIALHRRLRTWNCRIDAFIALTAFQKDKLAAAGLPEERIHVKPHFYNEAPLPLPWVEREPVFVFVGRLGVEKGVHILIDVWNRWGQSAPVLEIIGDGPEQAALEKKAEAGNTGKIRFRGQLSFSETQNALARACMLILPSLWFEGFPMVICEAFALGVPVAASKIGSMPEIITEGETGVLFDPGDTQDLFNKLNILWQNTNQLTAMALNARSAYEISYTADRNYMMLIEIYQKAMSLLNY